MSTDNDALLKILKEIRDLLIPISVCYEEQYLEIQRNRVGAKLKILKNKLKTPVRKKIYPLLFDPRGLSQLEIANEVQVTQQAVSKLVNELLDEDLIELTKSENGNLVYRDKYDLTKLL